MATIVAVRSGNWSDTSHVTGPWPGGTTPTTKPGVGDTVQADANVVTIDEDVTVALLEATSSGYFALTAAPELPAVRTITAAVLNSGSATGTLNISNPTGRVVLSGDLTGGTMNGVNAVYNTGTIGDITGNLTGGAMNAANAVYNGGTIGDITGDLTAGDAGGAFAVYNGGTIGDITGDLTAGDANSAWAVYNGGGTIGDNTGDLTAGNASGAWAVYNNRGTIGDITGDVTGGDADGAWAVYNNGGTIGDITGSLICGATGQFPINGPFRMTADPANSITVRQPNGDHWTLSNDYPAEADVKSGVDYNRGTQTGELATGGSIVIGGGGIRIS